jgi:3-dehydroquinate synthetase
MRAAIRSTSDRAARRPGLILPYLKSKRVAVMTNDVVGPLYLADFVAGLRKQGVSVTEIVLPDGEAHKDWPTLNLIFDGLLGERCDRSTTLIALGGGVVGDMVGFAAAATSVACPSSRCRPRCCPRWIRRWAARRRSTTRSART